MARMKFSTKAKRSFARATGIPTTRSGRSRKVSRATGGCLTLVLSVLLLVVLLVFIISTIATAEAEAGSIHSYVESLGFVFSDISDIDEPSAKCYMLEGEDTQSLAFTEDGKLYGIVGLSVLDVNYDFQKLRDLFLDLVSTYRWDVSFYWPEYDTDAKIKVSYGIVEDLDKTDDNYHDMAAYISALSSALHESADENSSESFASIEDLSTYSYDELLALKEKINLAMWQSEEWQEVIVPQGVWVVGEDIPEGHWTIKAVDGVLTHVTICSALDETGHKEAKGALIDFAFIKSPSRSTFSKGEDIAEKDFILAPGMFVIINDGDSVFTPYNGKPTLGFK